MMNLTIYLTSIVLLVVLTSLYTYKQFHKKTMKATIRAYPCLDGDCIFMKLEDPKSCESFHIMVDCGAYGKDIHDYIRDELKYRIDLLVATHIDRDHIDGITAMLLDPDMANLKIGKILYNCYQNHKIEKQPLDPTIKTQIEMLGNLMSETAGSQISVKGSVSLAATIIDKGFADVWEKSIVKDDTPNLPLGQKWGELIFLSPSKGALEDLYEIFKVEYAGITAVQIPDAPFEKIEEMYELLLKLNSLRKRKLSFRTIKDKDVAHTPIRVDVPMMEAAYTEDPKEDSLSEENKSSIAFVWKCNGHKVLFGGDAMARKMLSTMKEKLGECNQRFDVIKVPHHGSSFNASVELYEYADSDTYFFTGGENGKRPSLEAISKIVKKGEQDCKLRTLHYNFVTDLTEALDCDEADSLQKKYNFKMMRGNNYSTYAFEY